MIFTTSILSVEKLYHVSRMTNFSLSRYRGYVRRKGILQDGVARCLNRACHFI